MKLTPAEVQVLKVALLGLPPNIGIAGLSRADTKDTILNLLQKLTEEELKKEEAA